MFEKAMFETMPYQLARPIAAASELLPLVIFLHGVGERGDDNEAPTSYGFFNNPASLFGTETAKQHPAFILVPQASLTDKWTPVSEWAAPVHFSPVPSVTSDRLWRLIQNVVAHNKVDPQRLYVTGLSMGAFGAYDLSARHSDVVAAIVAVCGAADLGQAAKLAPIPTTIFHGTRDKVVPVKQSRDLVKEIHRAGGSPRYIEYSDLAHLAWDRAFADPELIQWLFQQKKPPHDRRP